MTQAANAAPATRESAVVDEHQNDGATPPFDENMAVCDLSGQSPPRRPYHHNVVLTCLSQQLPHRMACLCSKGFGAMSFCENSPAMAMHRFLEESCVAEVFLTWVLLSNECGLEK